MVISPSPSRLGGRVSRRTTWGCCSCSSAESSQVMMRSSWSIEPVRQLSSVVLPEPVPPEISTLQRTRPMISSSVLVSGEIEPYLTSCSSLRRSFLNLRMVSAGPSIASGGAMTLTRLPSGRRASQIGLDSSTRRPTWLTMRWQMFMSCGVVGKAHARLLHLAGHLDVGRAGAVDHDVGDVVARQQRLERAVAQHVVADVLEQLLLLGDRHHDVLDLDDLADDVADLLARRRRCRAWRAG